MTAIVPPELINSINALVAGYDTLGKQVSALTTMVAELATQNKELGFQQHLNTSLSLFFAEEQLGGSRPEILQQALTDLPDIIAMVGKARQGK